MVQRRSNTKLILLVQQTVIESPILVTYFQRKENKTRLKTWVDKEASEIIN